MGRRKSYSSDDSLLSARRQASSDSAENARRTARFDIVELLGEQIRLAGSALRTFDLTHWLGRGIDEWVFAAIHCLKTILLRGDRQPATVTNYLNDIQKLFSFLTSVFHEDTEMQPIRQPQAPANLTPSHIAAFTDWIINFNQRQGRPQESTRKTVSNLKSVIHEMIELGMINGPLETYFPKRAVRRDQINERGETALTEAEQQRLSMAIKSDLSDLHHNRIALSQGHIQALRLMVIAHRQGLNPTPLLELQRDALLPGLVPGTIRIRTAKYRSRKIRTSVGRARTHTPTESAGAADGVADIHSEIVFSLSEGAVLQQAIESTRELARDAPRHLKNRVWLYRSEQAQSKGTITCLTASALKTATRELLRRHNLLSDDGSKLRLNLSRLRKSFFSRAMRTTENDLLVTANLMGNTPSVSAINYSSITDVEKAEAASFMNEDYLSMMRLRKSPQGIKEALESDSLQASELKPVKITRVKRPSQDAVETPISHCQDSLHGEHSPKDGSNHCSRYVMCLFCASFAVVGAVDELWRLFSFQAFARAELEYIEGTLMAKHPAESAIEDLRDRYRVAIPYIDDFTARQFSRLAVEKARKKTAERMHPYWEYQVRISRAARDRALLAANP